MESLYQTSEEGIRKIRYNLLRQMPIEELEKISVRNPQDELVIQVLKESYQTAEKARRDHLCPPIKKTLVYCDGCTEIGRRIINDSIWWSIEGEPFYFQDPNITEIVTDTSFEKLEHIMGLLDQKYKDFIHLTTMENLLSRDSNLIIDLSRLNHPTGIRGRVQNYADLMGIKNHPEIICLYEEKGCFREIARLARGNKAG